MTLTEPQVWTLIGVFAAAIFGIQGIAISSFRREMQSIRNELVTRMESMETRIGVRLDQLDRDVQFLMRKEFGDQ
jgi:broad specificity polyphosphatase/5'/3'-nucleotidase SurE